RAVPESVDLARLAFGRSEDRRQHSFLNWVGVIDRTLQLRIEAVPFGNLRGKRACAEEQQHEAANQRPVRQVNPASHLQIIHKLSINSGASDNKTRPLSIRLESRARAGT